MLNNKINDNVMNDVDIKYIKGVGEARAKNLAKLNINTLNDLIEYFPKSYEDRTRTSDIASLVSGSFQLIKAKVITDVTNRYIRRNLSIQSAVVEDGSGTCDITWFNQRYVANNIKRGEEYVFYGKVEYKYGRPTMASPQYEKVGLNLKTGSILPVYPLTKGITQNTLRNIMRNGLEKAVIPENLPGWLLDSENLLKRNLSINEIHFPESDEKLQRSKTRLAFEELFFMQMALLYLKNFNKVEYGSKCSEEIKIDEIIQRLPFTLTNSQLKSIREIEKDLESDITMDRLLQGDVGSGKTIVSILAAYKAVKSGYQVAVMVPTAILASQHLESFKNILNDFGFKIDILKSGLKKSEKTRVLDELKNGNIDILIGTHALIEENVVFNNLGLVITDEQHRFGVKQRETILAKGNNPNVLVMSATPIPRTLALILYGDLDISIINELPKGRKPIKTAFASYKQEPQVNMFLRKQLEEGRQGYVVCPLVEENEELDLKSVEEIFKAYKTEFADYNVEFLHGKIKEKDKDIIMEKFLNKEIDILIATTVIEVGIDVPNANIIIIENAERFGLSQLHQLRGRVGRGEHQSYCLLKAKGESKLTKERIKIMCETTDGFVISEKDLELRGSGDFFGTKQHGIPDFKVANLFEDIELLKHVQEIANNIIKHDPFIKDEKNIMIKNKIDQMIKTVL